MQNRAYFMHSSRLGFGEWAEADLPLAMGLWGDAEVTRFIGGPFSETQVKERLLREITTAQTQGIQYWPIFALATAEHVGCCGLRPYDSTAKINELGFHIRRAYWGQGYALEAARTVLDYAFDKLQVSDLFAGHHPNNQVSRHLLAKLGFRYTHDEHFVPTGLNHPSYRLTAADYARKSKQV